MTQQPRILNLDELPTPASGLAIQHEGVRHEMAQLSVEAFIDQERVAQEHQKIIDAVLSGAPTEEQAEVSEGNAVRVIRDAVMGMFPTLPVNDIPVYKLFQIFAWLGQVSDAINQTGAETTSGNA